MSKSYAHAHLPKDVSAYSNNNPGSIRPVVRVRKAIATANFHRELSSRTSIANFHCKLPLRTSITNFHCSTLGWKLLTLLGFHSSRVFSSIAASGVWSMSIVKQCKFLEEKLISNHSFAEDVLSQSPTSIRDLKKQILDHDQSRTLVLSEGHPSLQYPLKRKCG